MAAGAGKIDDEIVTLEEKLLARAPNGGYLRFNSFAETHLMKFRSTVLFFLLISSAALAHAQLAVYGKLDAIRYKDNTNLNYTNWFIGAGGIGAYYDFVHAGPIAAGVDVRGDFTFGGDQGYRSGLVGVRVAAKPPLMPVKPYVQFSVGGGGSRVGSPTLDTHYSTKFQYDIFGGADFTVLPHVDWRVVEVGYGRMNGISASTTSTTASIVTFATGVVFRIK